MKTALSLLITLGLSGIYLAAGLLKIADPEGFAKEIESFQLISSDLALWVACSVPILEVLSAILVWLPWCTTKTASKGAFVLLPVAFLTVYSWALAHGISPHCGCFGKIAWLEVTPTGGVIRSTILLAAALWLWHSHTKQPSPSSALNV